MPNSLPLALPPDHVGLYIHIPYCLRKCRYCDFASNAITSGSSEMDRYLDALAREADYRRRMLHRPVHSIYIGGGTPTMLTGAQLRRLWEEVVEPFPRMHDAEVTLEANPGTLTDAVLAALATMALTRVSLGVQSLHAHELALLGRVHSVAEVESSVTALRAIGIPRINLDLMYGLPGQSVTAWRESVLHALALVPDHLSPYSLILEEGTPLACDVAAGLATLPGEDVEDEMTHALDHLLDAAGFIRYEVSNAAPTGGHSRHNLGYWLGRDYLGLGASAASMLNGVRWRNCEQTPEYLTRIERQQNAVEYAERLSGRTRLLERVMLGLRLRDGFDLAAAEEECGRRLAEVAPGATASLREEELLEIDGAYCRLTTAGYSLANAVVARLMCEGV